MLATPTFVFDVDPLDPNSESDLGSSNSSKTREILTSGEIAGERGVRQESTPASKKVAREPLQQYYAFRFTFEKVDPQILVDWLDDNAEAYGYQVEQGARGQKHYQGTFDLGRQNRLRVTPLQAMLSESIPKLEFPVKDYCKRSMSNAANRYGMKEESRVDGPWYKGVVFDEIADELVYKVDIELRPWQLKIKDRVLDVDSDNRHIWLFWEPNGGLGKTTFQKWIYQNYANVLVVGGKAADMKNAIVELLDKQAKSGLPLKLPDIIIINIPKSYNTDYFCPTGTEEVKDMFFQSGKYHGGMVDGRPPKMIIFANKEPPKFRDMAWDRLKIIELPHGPGNSHVHEEKWYE